MLKNILIFTIIVLITACSLTIKVKESPLSTVKIQIVDDYIFDCGSVMVATGCARKRGNHYLIQISRKSPDHEQTLRHEMEHVGRWMVGLPPNWLRH